MVARSAIPLLTLLLLVGFSPAQEAPTSRLATTATIEGRVLLDEGFASKPGLKVGVHVEWEKQSKHDRSSGVV